MEAAWAGVADFWRLRVVTYAVGAVEFAQNVALNIHGAVTAPTDSVASFHGKLCVVTGANAGIGRSTTEALVRRGGTVVMACRSSAKARKAAQEIEQLAPLPGCKLGSIEVCELDLASMASVKRFSRNFCKQKRDLDLLICNAGIMAPPIRSETEDNLELQFQVNYLAHWTLIHDLASHHLSQGFPPRATSATHQPQAPNGGALRILWLTSMTHMGGMLDFDNLQLCKGYSGLQGYANSKLATILAVKEFQRRLDRKSTASTASGVFCAVHPGLVDTHLANEWLTGTDVVPAALQRIIRPVVRLICPWILAPPERAVQTILYAATAPSPKVKGQYIANCKVARPSKRACDVKAAAHLWEASRVLSSTIVHPCFQ